MTSASASPRSESPKVLDRALAVLDLFDDQRPEWSVPGIAAAVELPVSTCYRIVRALESHGLLRSTSRGRIRLGVAGISLGRRASRSFDLIDVLRPELEQLAADTQETVTLSVIDYRRHGALCLDRVEASRILRLSLEVGSSIPLYAGATSKALLAFCAEDTREAVLSGNLEPLGPGTIVDPNELRAELESIRERGWSATAEETTDGVWGVAVPILAEDRTPIAAFGVSAPGTRYSEEIKERAIEFAVAAARRAAARLRG